MVLPRVRRNGFVELRPVAMLCGTFTTLWFCIGPRTSHHQANGLLLFQQRWTLSIAGTLSTDEDLMDYNHIALFVRVVRAGSFTAAATQLGLPKSSVSRGVSHLERDLGVRLLQRTSRKLALTTAGEAYFERVNGSVAAMDEADASAREHGSEPSGVVRISAPPNFGALALAMARFNRQYPGIRVELTVTSRMVDIVSEGFDMAVRAGRLGDSSLVARRIGATEMVLVASSAYLRRRGRPKSVDELSIHDWVLYRAIGGRASIQLDGPDGPRTIEVSGALIADDLSFCLAAVEGGAGIALLPVQQLVDSMAAGTLEQVLPAWTNGNTPVSVVLPTSRHVPARVALLRDFIVADVGEQLAALKTQCESRRKRTAAGA